ncbi:T9SS type B sorting domain-containing protein [Flavobacterium sp. 102]|uniref:T9SS type B sorting domain-containing protein n=1 Tax=Flavobacterium sp. 102 TaxID=2135623 RepID=UPI000EAEF8B7|nr:T9SS type B sorting domain-containing protein [Flavobacterium sp. 102]RKS02724.1 gliding motility-associated-like protein [Flavobacterium sp. 102]
MKKIYFYLLIISLFSIHSVFSQGSTCPGAQPFCAGGSALTFPNTTGVPSTGAVSCLSTTPNPAWFFLQISVAGTLNFTISQNSNGGGGIDVDFIAWGPFAGPTCAGTDLSAANQVGCSYSTAATENFTIPNAQVGEVYMVLLTNFADQAGQISLTQTNAGTGGAGATDCNIVCPLSLDDQVICVGGQAILTATIDSATSYAWSGPSGPIASTAQSITVSQAGTYTVVVNKPGCVANATASATVSFYAPPPINLPVNLEECTPNPVYNLNEAIANIFNGTGLNSSDFEASFHTSAANAQDIISPIGNPSAYPGPAGGAGACSTIYLSLTDNGPTSSGCVSVFSFTICNITCSLEPNVPPNLTLCESSLGSGTANFNFIPQTPIVLGTQYSAANHTVTYHLTQANADNDVGAITSVVGTNGQTIYVRLEENANPTTFGTTFFQLIVNPLPTVTISGTTSICSGNNTVITFNGTPNAQVTYNVNGNPNEIITLDGTGTNTITTPNLTANSTYTLVSVLNPVTNCSRNITGTAVVTVLPLPTASISGTTAVCQNAVSPQITLTGASGTAPYTFTYSINNVVQPTVTTLAGNSFSFNAPTATAGTFVYSLINVSGSGTPTCSQNQDGTATITVNPLPTAVITGSVASCLNAPYPQVIITGANGTQPYTFTYTLNNGAPISNSTTGGNSFIIDVPTDVAGSFTYDLISVVDDSSTSCSQLQSGSAVVTVATPPVISQPTDYVVCDDNNDTISCLFDLGTKINEVNGGNPNIVVDFYETDTSGSAIPLNVNYCNLTTGLGIQTIYVRAYFVGSPACYSTTTFNLIVNPIPMPNPVIEDYELCDYNSTGDEIEVFTLNSMDTEIANGQTNVTISYYLTQSDAQTQTGSLANSYPNTSNPQQIWFNIRNNTTGCFSVGSFNLIVNPIPPAVTPPTLFECSDGLTNQAEFDLTINEAFVTNNNVSGLTITYYNTLLDAQNEVTANAIQDPLAYIGTDNEIVYIRVEDNATGCYATTTQLLRVTQGPIAITPQALHYCDPNNDGFGFFDLESTRIEIMGGTAVAGVSVSYYETETDALIGAAPSIISPYENINPWTQTIYVRVFYTLTGCANYVQLQLIVDPTPEATEPDDYELCDYTGQIGYEAFDLTTTEPQILGTIDPSLVNVTFHPTFVDAQNETATITGVTNYINQTQWSQTLFVRVEFIATGCYDIVELDLIVNPLPNATQPNYPQYTLCDYNGAIGFETFDLLSQVDPILLGQQGMSVTFYPSLAAAQAQVPGTSINETHPDLQYPNQIIYVQTLGVVITNTLTGCYSISTIDIRVVPLPTPIPPTAPYTICDENQDGFSSFDLATLTADILQGANYILTFYETLSDAELGNLVTAIDITQLYDNINPFTQILYVRAEDPLTGCWSVIPIVLNVNPSPIAPINLDDIVVCDTDNNNQSASTIVDLTVRTPDVLAQQPLAASNYTITYHTTLLRAQNDIPIIPATSYLATTNQTIWVRVEDNTTGCFNIGEFDIIVNIPLLLITPTPLSLCDDDANPNDQFHSFDLTIRDVMITQSLSGYTVTYYPSYALAQAGNPANAIATPTAYTNTSPAVQTLGVVVTSAAGCSSVTTLDIRVLPIPTPNTNPPSLGAKCDDNNPGDMMEVFDLTVNAAYILNGDPNLTLHYYHSQADALVPQNEIPLSTVTAALVGDVDPNEQSVWIRVENNRIDSFGNHCFVLVEQPLTVNPLPTVVQPLAPYRVCDNDTDGLAAFDLTNPILATAILGATQNPADFTITYYLTQAGANPLTNTGETPLPNNYTNTTPDSQNIYIRVVNNATGCVNATGVLTLAVEEYAQATGPQSFSSCDTYTDPYDGVFQLDLTQYETAILNGQDPLVFLISYYHTQADAEQGINAITLAEAQAYITQPDTDQIWVKVENSSNSITPFCYALTTIDIEIERYPNPIITTPNGVTTICVDFTSGLVVRPLTLNSNIPNPADYTFEWYEGTTLIPGATGSTYTVDTASPTGATRSYTVRVISNSLLACETTSLGFDVIQSGPASISTGTAGYTVTNAFTNSQIITVTVEGWGTYEYSLDDGPRQTSNIFEGVSLGNHVIHVWDTEGGIAFSCEELMINDVQVIDYPHYFTPNGDGIHDTWNVVGLFNYAAQTKIFIFDRYGKLLKQISSAGDGWDGTYNGQPLPSTDYWFTVDYPEQGGMKQFKAHFSLKR